LRSLEIDGAALKYQSDGTTLRVPLPRPLPPNESATLTLDFVVRVPELIWTHCARLGAETFHAFLRDLYQRGACHLITTADFFKILIDTRISVNASCKERFFQFQRISATSFPARCAGGAPGESTRE